MGGHWQWTVASEATSLTYQQPHLLTPQTTRNLLPWYAHFPLEKCVSWNRMIWIAENLYLACLCLVFQNDTGSGADHIEQRIAEP